MEKKLIKVRVKITYLYKSVDIIFLLHLRSHQNFKNYHAGKLNKTDLVNTRFAYPSKTVSCKLSFYFCLDVQTRWHLYIHLEKDYFPCFCVSMKYLVVWIH